MDRLAEEKMIEGVDSIYELLELLGVLEQSYYGFLLKAGFAEDEAITIITAYQETVLKLLTRKE